MQSIIAENPNRGRLLVVSFFLGAMFFFSTMASQRETLDAITGFVAPIFYGLQANRRWYFIILGAVLLLITFAMSNFGRRVKLPAYWNLYFAYAMYNTFASFLQGDPLWGLQSLIYMGCYLTAIHLALIRIQSEASVTYVARALVLTFLVQMLLVGLQYSINEKGVLHVPTSRFLGTLGNAAHWGVHAAAAAVIGFWVASNGSASKIWRLLGWSAVIAATGSILWSGTRTGTLALLVGRGFFFNQVSFRRVIQVGFFTGVLLVLRYVLINFVEVSSGVEERLEVASFFDLSTRMEVWSNLLSAFFENFLFGTGRLQLETGSQFVNSENALLYTHNRYGVFSLALLLSVVVASLITCAKIFREKAPKGTLTQRQLAASLLLTFCIASVATGQPVLRVPVSVIPFALAALACSSSIATPGMLPKKFQSYGQEN